jgi:hypothetical protein
MPINKKKQRKLDRLARKNQLRAGEHHRSRNLIGHLYLPVPVTKIIADYVSVFCPTEEKPMPKPPGPGGTVSYSIPRYGDFSYNPWHIDLPRAKLEFEKPPAGYVCTSNDIWVPPTNVLTEIDVFRYSKFERRRSK